eukprot:CAMPEP_0183306650 /NCGR_PEP_ID=MMETSP0160_2-20130417/13506_1 /TAXON_ID=2839 ORGANISM="Odontella Sinensis, Strain Grunow 1884" /NCGR_SAMPLE_ID=MMETSP0160_2 /ASSEMBLY_ACC=CAM_ASM_000250 /LENGTH=473 /DNA_ID=CAMNT_0025470083 /DNA_START=34 /DNA_END=1455 /DNA_ORIENTATION=+
MAIAATSAAVVLLLFNIPLVSSFTLRPEIKRAWTSEYSNSGRQPTLRAATSGAVDGPVHSLLHQSAVRSLLENSIKPQSAHAQQYPDARDFLFSDIFGRIRRVASNVGPALSRILEVVDPLDIAYLSAVAFGSRELLRIYNNHVLNPLFRRERPKPFDESKLSAVGDLTCQVGQCALAAYSCEILVAFLDAMGIHAPPSASQTIAMAIFAGWGARKASQVKRGLLERFFDRVPSRGGRRKRAQSARVFYDRFSDIAIYLLTAGIVLEMCGTFQPVVRSLLSVAGLSSLVLGLSLRDPLSQILQGTSLLVLNHFSPGDKIKLADGTVGRVIEMGWLDTTIMGSDDIFVRIPNSEIASRRIYNISRMKRSRVKEVLRFHYADVEKLPGLMEDIKAEIRESCSNVIVNGSRPLRAHLRECHHDHVAVVVEAHFNITPRTSEFYDEQERALLAMVRAVKSNGLDFAIPSRLVLREEG